jgi:NAD kinase
MERSTENKIVIVSRRTRLEELIVRFNTREQARFYIEHSGGDFSDYLNEDLAYREALRKARLTLETLGRVQMLDREFLPNFVFGPDDIVVSIGQDGLVANTLKYLTSQPLIGVNPDPSRWDGVLLPFKVRDLGAIVPEVFQRRRSLKQVTMAEVHLQDGQSLLAVNDLFIGMKTHTSARYLLTVGGVTERQSSSGVIISTGMGSTGWLKSVLTGARAIVSGASGNRNESHPPALPMPWDTSRLVFTVREPYPSTNSQASLVFGHIAPDAPLRIQSLIPENGVIFSDGVEHDFLEFNSGAEAVVELSRRKGHLVT